MIQLKKILEKLTVAQLAAYNMISDKGFYRAEGHRIKTFRSLAKLGLIKINPDSPYKHDYIISHEAPRRKKKINVSQPKEVIRNIEAGKVQKAKSIICPAGPPKAVYSNTSREQHVEKWIGKEMPKDVVLPVKTLNDTQMEFIVMNYEKMEAQEMADKLKVDVLYIRMFCQLNGFVIFKKKKKWDTFHAIPIERKQRMSRVSYNGHQKKTA